MDIALIVVLGLLGALLGSFAGAQVWRLRAHQLVQDTQDGEEVDKQEVKQLKGLIRPVMQDRSECLSCHHKLAWYDLLPVISWVTLRGKCRYCKHAIGKTEVLAEIGLAAVFVLSYVAWPYQLSSSVSIAVFAFWLVGCVVMTVLFIYDAKWSLLPYRINMALIAVAIAYRLLATYAGAPIDVWSLVVGVLLLGGLYLLFSKFNWVGMGDGILGISLAIFLGNWQGAFLTLFLANLLGSLMLVPLYLTKQLHRQTRIPFGPFLIVAMVITMLYGSWILSMIFGPTSYLQNMLML